MSITESVRLSDKVGYYPNFLSIPVGNRNGQIVRLGWLTISDNLTALK